MQANIIALTACAVGLAVSACAEYSEPKSEEALLAEPAEPFDGASLTQVSGAETLPNLRDFIGGEEHAESLGLYQGTPPKFVDIDTPAEVEQHLTGPLPTLMASLRASVASQVWSRIEADLEMLRQAQSKCRIMQYSANMLQSLSTRLYSLCQVQAADQEQQLVHLKGVKFPVLLAMPSGTRAKVIEIQLQGEDPFEAIDEFYEKKYMIEINPPQKWSNEYSFSLSTCTKERSKSSWDASGLDILAVDNSSGVMSVSSNHKVFATDSRTYSLDLAYRSELFAPIFLYGGIYYYDFSQRRYVNVQETLEQNLIPESHYDRSEWRGQLSILGNLLTTKYYDTLDRKDDTGKYSGKVRGAAMVIFSGLTTETATFYEGAGRFKFKYKGDDFAETKEGNESIGFSFNETKSPTYQTTSVPPLFNQILNLGFKLDEILRDQAVDLSLKLSDKTCDNKSPDAVYLLNLSSEEFYPIAQQCVTPITNAPDMCTGLENLEREMWTLLEQCRSCKQHSQKGDDSDEDEKGNRKK